MNILDYRFDETSIKMLKTLVGKIMNYFLCDRLPNSSSTVYGAVVFSVENQKYAFTNYLESIDYINRKDDVGIFKFLSIDDEKEQGIFDECSPVKTPINQKIIGIKIINENQQLYRNSCLEYDIHTVRGIVLILEDGLEISFEKDIWFSEFIDVKKGYNLINSFTSTNSFIEEWEDSIYKPEIFREIIEV